LRQNGVENTGTFHRFSASGGTTTGSQRQRRGWKGWEKGGVGDDTATAEIENIPLFRSTVYTGKEGKSEGKKGELTKSTH